MHANETNDSQPADAPASTLQRSTCTTNAMPLPLLEWLERPGL